MAKTKSKGDTAKKKAKSRKAAPDTATTGKGSNAKASTDTVLALKARKGGSRKTAKSGSTAGSKSVAGVKIPKAFRKLGPIRDMLTSDLGREILADALVAAAGAAAMALTKARGTSDVKTVAKAAAQGVIHSAAGTVAGVVGEAARHFLPPGLLGDAQPVPAGGPAALPAPKAPAKSGAKAPSKSAAKRTAGKSGTGRSAAKRPPETAAAQPKPAAAQSSPAATSESDRTQTSSEAPPQE